MKLSKNEVEQKENSLRLERMQWAQRRIQVEYQRHGLSDEFTKGWLLWYLAVCALFHRPDFHLYCDGLIRFHTPLDHLLKKLDDAEKDRLTTFWLQLAEPGPRSLAAKWSDQGTPIYRWLNVAFSREWKNLKSSNIEAAAMFVQLGHDPDADQQTLTSGPDVIAAEPWFEPGSHGAENHRKERALVWNDTLQAEVRDKEAWLHPGNTIGIPAWEAIRSFEVKSPLHAAIVMAIRELGWVDYSKIARALNAAGFPVTHDKVRRIVKKFEAELAAVVQSKENIESRGNVHDNFVQHSIAIPEEEQKRRADFDARYGHDLTFEERIAANERWHAAQFRPGGPTTPITIVKSLPESNRIVFHGGKRDEVILRRRTINATETETATQ